MTSYEWERRIFWGLRAYYGYPAPTRYELQARASLNQKAASISHASLIRQLQSADCVLFGDDQSLPTDEERIRKMIRDSSKSGRFRGAMLLTDRLASAKARVPRWARENRMKIFRIRRMKSPPQGDEAFLKKVEAEAKRSRKLVLWTGSLRLAPAKLPKRLAKNSIKSVAISMHAYETRWRNRKKTGFMTLPNNVMANVEVSPFLTLEKFRNPESDIQEDLFELFQEALKKIQRRTGWRGKSAKASILHPYDLKPFEILARRSGDKDFRKFLRERLERGESAAFLRRKTVLLTSFDPGFIAEEAAHFHRLHNLKLKPVGTYGVLVEECFAFLASRWIDPKREIPKFYGDELTDWDQLHWLAYDLGAKLSRLWSRSSRVRSLTLKLWKRHYGDEAIAEEIWNELERVV